MEKLEHISLDESADRFLKMVRDVEKMGAKKVDARYLSPLNTERRFPLEDVDKITSALLSNEGGPILGEIFSLDTHDMAAFVGDGQEIDQLLKKFQKSSGTTFIQDLDLDK